MVKHRPISPKVLQDTRMHQLALGCFLAEPGIQITDGKVIGLLKPDALITHQYEWSSKETLVLGLRHLYESLGGNIELTTYSVASSNGGRTYYNAIAFTGEALLKQFSEDLAAYQAAAKGKTGKA